MQQQISKFGIYLNSKENQVVRINSPYWIPEEPDWVFLTPEVNATLLQIRDMAKGKGISGATDSIVWGTIPSRD
ncbi:MAG: hypothetical protein O2909_04780 [Chloroflexi bacterium]|nr:hypothetical protein [Chloroflexota bacterium]MDA1218739.1 hypothetical protein [Chloroflexota bacterium]PKB58036.1 MAG: hypothetical protein BZY73_00110 [SAR202 cluster bacterium Casp-Chloro-G3]